MNLNAPALFCLRSCGECSRFGSWSFLFEEATFSVQFKKLLPGLYHAAIDNSKYYLFTGGGTVLKVIEVRGLLLTYCSLYKHPKIIFLARDPKVSALKNLLWQAATPPF